MFSAAKVVLLLACFRLGALAEDQQRQVSGDEQVLKQVRQSRRRSSIEKDGAVALVIDPAGEGSVARAAAIDGPTKFGARLMRRDIGEVTAHPDASTASLLEDEADSRAHAPVPAPPGMGNQGAAPTAPSTSSNSTSFADAPAYVENFNITNGSVMDGNTSYYLIGGTFLVLAKKPEAFILDGLATYSLKFVVATECGIETTSVSLGLDKVGHHVFASDNTPRGMIRARFCALYPEARTVPNSGEKMQELQQLSPALWTQNLGKVLDYLQLNYTADVSFAGAMLGCETQLLEGDVINGIPV